MPVTFFPVTSPVSKTFAFLRARYAIYRCMFTVGFQCNFRKITARFSGVRRLQLVVSCMLPFWSPWFKHRFIKIDLVTVGNFCFNVRHVLGGVVDCVIREFTKPRRQRERERERHRTSKDLMARTMAVHVRSNF